MKRISLVIGLFFLVSLVEAFSQHKWVGGDVLRYDPSGYYLYLPAAFIYHDVTRLSFYPGIEDKYHPSGDIKWHSIYEQPHTGKRLNKYSAGTALGELPFFLITDAWLRFSNQYPRDGYSTPYQFAVGMSTIMWAVLGLIVLSRFLLRLFNGSAVLVTIFLLAFGTNLYCYTSYELGMSHSLLFLLFACTLSLTERWYATRKLLIAVALGLVLGWITITRPTDIAIACIPLLWPIGDGHSRFTFFRKHFAHLFAAIAAFFIVVLVQMLYWKAVTGSYIVYSYQGEYFDFLSPHVGDGLFSFRKGWFIYTPLAFAAVLGFFALSKLKRPIVLPLLSALIAIIYLSFSWHQWYYGWGFGARPLVGALAIVSIPLAALISVLLKRRLTAILSVIVGVSLVALNIFQTNQYAAAIIDGSGMTREYYWRVFGKMHASDEDKKLLYHGE